MKIIVAGDYCDTHRVHEAIVSQNYTFFNEVKTILSTADYAIVNFEFPIANHKDSPIQKCGPCLSGSLNSISAIKYAGFNCCTLANNHILDYGEQACLNTIRAIDSNGIDTVGAGENLESASNTLFKEINGEQIAIINCCEHEFSIATESNGGANPLNPIQQYYKILEAKQTSDYVIVIVHGGCENYSLPTPRMQETYRFFIDAGADAVINHHQHCYSGYENYNSKMIFYGLGNFCFDSKTQCNSQWNQGYMVLLELTKTHSAYEIVPYLQFNEKPCIELITGRDLLSFHDTIKSLNFIISDKSLLNKEYEAFEASNISTYDSIISPYFSRVLLALRRHKLLPRVYSKRKMISLLAIVQCESHRERLISLLKRIIYK